MNARDKLINRKWYWSGDAWMQWRSTYEAFQLQSGDWVNLNDQKDYGQGHDNIPSNGEAE